MNICPNRLKYQISVMQACLEGKTIEWRPLGNDQPWQETQCPGWKWCECDYRVKPPEPRVIYVNEYPNYVKAHLTEDAARQAVGPGVLRVAVPYAQVKP